MTEITITGADLVLPDRVLEKTSITIKEDRISAIGDPPSKSAEVIEAAGKYVLPGLIDIHTHGRIISLDPKTLPHALARDCMDLARAGTTRFLPTLASAPIEAWMGAMPVLAELIADPPPGAVPVGLHLEGIFLNHEAAGAHPLELIKPFDQKNPNHRSIFDKFSGIVKIITFAPEVAGNEALAKLCGEHGILASLGHSTASPDQVRSFVDQGVNHMAHLFNGMKGIHHREPGPPLKGLLDDRISVELICDGHHLHPEIVRLIHRCKPPEKRVLITDSVLVNLPGATPGQGDEPNRLPDGRLAGSRLQLSRGVKNYVRFTDCPLPEAVAMASLNPASLLGIDHEAGSLDPGKIADLWIADHDLETIAVFGQGRKIFP